jgi:hypothetical protein
MWYYGDVTETFVEAKRTEAQRMMTRPVYSPADADSMVGRRWTVGVEQLRAAVVAALAR